MLSVMTSSASLPSAPAAPSSLPPSNDATESNMSIPAVSLSILPPHTPFLLSSLSSDSPDQSKSLDALTAWLTPSSSSRHRKRKSSEPLTLPIHALRSLTALPLSSLIDSHENTAPPSSSSYTLYRLPHNPLIPHTSSTTPPPAPALLASLAYSSHCLSSLQARRRRVDRHIVSLHRYNEMKDVCQMLLGKLAELEGGLTKEMYPRFGLQLED